MCSSGTDTVQQQMVNATVMVLLRYSKQFAYN
jgi:hypothetical protein